jgi:hypothetical protein
MRIIMKRIAYIICITFLLNSMPALALDQIIRPYQSVRSAGMGNVRMTTGLYDENFFNNPARVTANPESRFTLIQLTPIETTTSTVKNASDLGKSGDSLTTAAGLAGDHLFGRTQIILPAYYLATTESRRWALAFGMIASIQASGIIRKSYNLDVGAIADVGPALTFGRQFLSDDSLSVGLTGHLTYRLATNPNYSLLDYVRGTSLSVSTIGGEGALYDFDLGTTYRFAELLEFQISAGGAIQNILGGNYDKISLQPLKLTQRPQSQPRSYGLGVSAERKSLLFLTDTILAFEMTDVLNNRNGSLFRLLHFGGETHWKSFAFRLGLNQGYLTAGFGINFHYLTIDIATYGEELGLNAGTFEDRRYTLNLGLHI